jgi:hypothetical protein
MTWVVVLHLLSAVPSVSSGAPSARLLARADVTPPVDPALAPPDTVAAQVAALSLRIRAINVNWPTAAVVLSYVGGIVVYVAVVTALVLLPLASLAGTPLLVLLGVAIAGAGMLIGGLVIGSNTAAAAKAERDELIRERDRLQREVRPEVAPPPGVERWAPVEATVVLAQF